MVAGYGVYELVIFGTAYAVTSLPFNMIQWGSGRWNCPAFVSAIFKIT